jgi:fructose-bisphosphate aldolase class II
MMKLLLLCILAPVALAFAPTVSFVQKLVSTSSLRSVSEEFGLPCLDECALEKYPNLPESVHPGVLSGKAMMDLLADAKAKGTNQ